MDNSQPITIHVTFEIYKRLVTPKNDTYDALMDAFLETFADVLPVSKEEARAHILFQRYVEEFDDYVDIHPGDSIAGIKKVKAIWKIPLNRIGASYPLVNNYIYNLWSFGSSTRDGFIRRTSQGNCLKADGNINCANCEWKAHRETVNDVIYWWFSTIDDKKVMAVKNGQVVWKDKSTAGTSDQFIPYINGRYQSFLPRDNTGTARFLGVDSADAITLIENQTPNEGKKLYNPTPQALFIPYLIRQ